MFELQHSAWSAAVGPSVRPSAGGRKCVATVSIRLLCLQLPSLLAACSPLSPRFHSFSTTIQPNCAACHPYTPPDSSSLNRIFMAFHTVEMQIDYHLVPVIHIRICTKTNRSQNLQIRNKRQFLLELYTPSGEAVFIETLPLIYY